MKQAILYIFLMGLTSEILLVSCEENPADQPEIKKIELSAQEKSLVLSNNDFSFRLMKTIHSLEKDKDQIFISPYSIMEALSMTYNGAAGETADSMEKILGFEGMSRDEINSFCLELRNSLLSVDPKIQLSMANSIWYQTGFYVLPGFIEANQQYYDAVVENLNFSDPTAKDQINGWIEEKTNNRIPGMIKYIEPDIVMFLINAIYFKGQWSSRFDKEDTQLKTFYAPGNILLQTPTMEQTNTFLYYANTKVQVAELPYGRKNFAMVILLPKDEFSIDQILEDITPEIWEQWISGMYESKLHIELPRFKFSYDIRLNDALKSMGMANAFDSPPADFTGINPEGDLYISYVQHNSFVEVNEEGTEAAAATVVAIGKETSTIEEIDFRVNKPFAFAIRERSTGTILFMGKISKPIPGN